MSAGPPATCASALVARPAQLAVEFGVPWRLPTENQPDAEPGQLRQLLARVRAGPIDSGTQPAFYPAEGGTVPLTALGQLIVAQNSREAESWPVPGSPVTPVWVPVVRHGITESARLLPVQPGSVSASGGIERRCNGQDRVSAHRGRRIRL